MRKKVVIACISGRGGAVGSGMNNLRDRLRSELAPIGVPPENIFQRSWNRHEDENPFGSPDTNDIVNEIQERSHNPAYLALIGHSYGAWAACRVSNQTVRSPDFVALIDAVFGPTNTLVAGDAPRGTFIKNWFQDNAIVAGDPCTEFGKVPCTPAQNGLSCGVAEIPGAHENQNEHFLKNWDGDRKRVDCMFGHRHMLTAHTNIDDDEWIWRQIRDKLYSDISTLPYTVRFRTRRGYYFNAFDSIGAVSAIPTFNADPMISDEIFTVRKIFGAPTAAIQSDDRIQICTRRGCYFNSFDSTGAVSAIPTFSADPLVSDEIFRIRKVGGSPSDDIHSGDQVELITRRGYYFNIFDSIGAVSAIPTASPNPAISDEIFFIDFVG